MNKIHKQRLLYIFLFTIMLGLAASLILYALKQNINVFLTPTQLASTHPSADYHLRLGGMVKKNSVTREKNNLNTHFIITDFKHEVRIQYNGILPDLFREGKGVVVEGNLNAQGTLIASQVLAKHDENYMAKNASRFTEHKKDAAHD